MSSLRRRVALPPEHDITSQQWSALELGLATAQSRLSARVKRAADQYLGNADDVRIARSLNAVLGEIELELSRAFTFFDTYMDVLTQRHSGESGAGARRLRCARVAGDAAGASDLTVIEAPLVFCDRGFGAAIVRESVAFPDGTPNPMPLIQIPYSRLQREVQPDVAAPRGRTSVAARLS